MNCRPLYVGKTSIGDRFDDGKVFVFFSNRFFTEREFRRLFPERKLVFNKQTHSDIINSVDSNTFLPETPGDALITSEKNLALGIYTADCLPILIHDPQGNKIASVHAGWRGVEQNILTKTLETLKPSNPELLRLWIGPHIKRDSFEVHNDVAEKLRAKSKSTQQVAFQHLTDQNKKYVDLAEIVLSQAVSFGVSKNNTWIHSINTFGDQNYYSYRRDGSTGRLISFIVLAE